MTPRDQHTTRRAAAGLLAAAGLALAGCGADEPEPGTEVEDIVEGEVVESDAAVEPGPQATGSALPFYGAYDRQFVEDRAVHEGQEVTLTGEVESVVSPSALTIGDPDDVTLDPLLVVHDLDGPDLAEDQAVEVDGTVMASFELTAAEEELGVDLEDELYADYEGEPWLHATDLNVTGEG